MTLTVTLARLDSDVRSAAAAVGALRTLASEDAPAEPSVVLADVLADDAAAAAGDLAAACGAAGTAVAAARARDLAAVHDALSRTGVALRRARGRVERHLDPADLSCGLLDAMTRPVWAEWGRTAVAALAETGAALVQAQDALSEAWEDLADRLVDRLGRRPDALLPLIPTAHGGH